MDEPRLNTKPPPFIVTMAGASVYFEGLIDRVLHLVERIQLSWSAFVPFMSGVSFCLSTFASFRSGLSLSWSAFA